MSAAGRCGAKRSLIAATVVSAVIGLSGTAYGSVVTSIPGGYIYSFPDNGIGIESLGPETVSSGVTWSSNVKYWDGNSLIQGSAYGVTADYGFSGNKNWIGTPAVALDYSLGTMTIKFDTPVAAVGGYINWASTGTASIAAYDSNNILIELLLLNNTGYTPDSFYGFSESTNSIMYFTLSNNYIGLRSLTTAMVTPTPLPGALPLFIGGLGALGLLGWRRRSKAAA